MLEYTILYPHKRAESRGALPLATFSERLIQLRKEKRLSQEALAKKLEIGSRAYQYYESGERLPRLDVLLKLADFFSVSLDYLAGRSDTP